MKKTTMPGMPEVEVVEIKTSAPVNVLADPAPAKKPAAKRTRKTAAAKTTAAKTEAKKPAAKRGRKPKAATAAAKKAEGPKKPTALIIMDGFGHREETKGNAIEAAKKPNLNKIFAENPLTYIGASGLDVGLPDGQMGNSEVGHTNIGAGRIVYQELTRITKAIQDGDFFENPALMSAINQCKWFGSTLHIFGLLSDGGVHSHIDHMFALLELARRNGLRKVCFHCFMDGRDTPPQSGIEYIDRLQAKIDAVEVGCIATVSGRYYAMDRDKNWDRVEKAYNALTKGEGNHAEYAAEAIQASYDDGKTDEFMLPTVITENGTPVGTIKTGDSVIFFNFRPDRARQLTRAFCDEEFTGFDRGERVKTTFVCFTDYDETIQNKLVAFKKESITNTFGEFLAAHNLKQARIAETEKYAHVTFFFNGGVEEPNPGEDRILVPSPKEVATYDLKPEMSAPAVCDKLVDCIKSGKYDVIITNFANPDMVGHTGVESAAIKAIEAVDVCVGRAVDAIKEVNGVLFICADHGNAEQLVDYTTGEPWTAHTTNPVPFILVNADPSYKLREGGCLADIAPTLIELMGMEQPKEMTGKSLLVK